MFLSIVCTVGIPGSGKTTVCRALVNSEEEHVAIAHSTDVNFSASTLSGSDRPTKCILISFDDLQHLTTDEYTTVISANESEELLSPYKVFRKGVQKLIESLIKYIKHGQELSLPERYNIPSIIEYLQPLPKISAGSNICLILDDTMCYPSMRYSYYQLARKYALGFGQIYFETPLDICLMRNSKRLGHERIDEQVIANMKEILKPPDVSCNPWEKHVFKITNGEFSTTSLSSLVSFINTCTEDIVPPLVAEGDREEGSRISVEDVIHQSDLILRQLVKSQIAANAGGSLVKEVAAQTNRCRKSLLNYLRAHAAELSDLLSESSPLPCRNPESALYRYIETLFLTQLHGH